MKKKTCIVILGSVALWGQETSGASSFFFLEDETHCSVLADPWYGFESVSKTWYSFKDLLFKGGNSYKNKSFKCTKNRITYNKLR